jgi:hypothetical protein
MRRIPLGHVGCHRVVMSSLPRRDGVGTIHLLFALRAALALGIGGALQSVSLSLVTEAWPDINNYIRNGERDSIDPLHRVGMRDDG